MDNKYDVVIIGAGIGGLVCGCYLAKAGMKVLIVEQHDKPGGYCTSFKKDGFLFDVAVHSLRGMKPENELGIILDDLAIRKKTAFIRINPSDIIVFKDTTINIYNEIEETKHAFKKTYPKQSKYLDRFFDFLSRKDIISICKLTKDKSFDEFLCEFISDRKARIPFEILLGNIGLGPKNVSALSACVLYKELFTDGGYYHKEGIQAFPNLLMKTFIENGGEILLRTRVTKILFKNNTPQGVILSNSTSIFSRIIVSNADALETYFDLIGKKHLPGNFIKHISSLKPSPSAFTLFLGLKRYLGNKLKCITTWYFPNSKTLSAYDNWNNNRSDFVGNYVISNMTSAINNNIYGLNDKPSLTLTCIAPYRTFKYWKENKEKIAERLIKTAGNLLGPLHDNILITRIGTPNTFFYYTNNYRGAAYGWASCPTQITRTVLAQRSIIKNLYLCGHWTTRGWGQGGVSMVANSGRTTAQMILKS